MFITNTYNFYAQTGICFVGGFNISNNYSYVGFNFLNEGEQASFRVDGGKIIDSYNDFISSFNKLDFVSFSGNLSENNFNLFVDNKLIYSEYFNYQKCTGFSVTSNSQAILDSLNFHVYGNKPQYLIYNESEVFSSQPFNFFISGDASNFESFNIYSINVGGTLDANLGNSSYIPRNFFEISGQSAWESGLQIEPGQVYEFTMLQKEYFSTDDGYTYVPIYIESEFGTIYKRLFIKVIAPESVEKLLLKIDSFNVNEAPQPFADFEGKFAFRAPKDNQKNFLIYLSGLNGNNNAALNYIDTFTGSWGISMEDIDFYPVILRSGDGVFFDDTIDLSPIYKEGVYYNFLTGSNYGNITGISGIAESNLIMRSGLYYGIYFNVPYFYNTTFDITGISLGLYTMGHYTGQKNEAFFSGISRANLNISLYSADSNYRLKEKMNSYNLILSGLKNTGDNEGNVFNLNDKYTLYTNQNYALVVDGYSSGIQYNYNLFLATGSSDFQTNYLENTLSISGRYSELGILPSITGLSHLPYIKIMGEHVTDDNILIGTGNLDVSNENIYKINMYKIYNFNNYNIFTGSAFFYISGFSGFERSGVLSVYEDIFRQINLGTDIY